MEVLPHDQISPGIPKLFIMTEYDLRFLTNKQTQAKTTTTKNKNHTQKTPPNHQTLPGLQKRQ